MVGRRFLTQPQKPCANCQDGCGYVRSGEAGFEVLCKRCPGRRALLPPSRLPPRVIKVGRRVVTAS
jgi:hypothetical protein